MQKDIRVILLNVQNTFRVCLGFLFKHAYMWINAYGKIGNYVNTQIALSAFPAIGSLYLPVTSHCVVCAVLQLPSPSRSPRERGLSEYSIRNMLETRQQTQNGVAYAKPPVPKPNFNYGSSSFRNGILNLSIRKSPDEHA